MKKNRILWLFILVAASHNATFLWAGNCAKPWDGSESEKKLFGMEGAYGGCRWHSHLTEGHPDVIAASTYICSHLYSLGLGTGLLDCSQAARDKARPWAEDRNSLVRLVKRKIRGAGSVTMVDPPGVEIRLHDGKTFFIRPYTDHVIHGAQCATCFQHHGEAACRQAAVNNPVFKLALEHGAGQCEASAASSAGGAPGTSGASVAGQPKGAPKTPAASAASPAAAEPASEDAEPSDEPDSSPAGWEEDAGRSAAEEVRRAHPDCDDPAAPGSIRALPKCDAAVVKQLSQTNSVDADDAASYWGWYRNQRQASSRPGRTGKRRHYFNNRR